MPQGENFWNPYRWVTVSNKPIAHDTPNYHHTLSGISGRIWCELEALTPLIIGDGNAPNIDGNAPNIKRFVRHSHDGPPYIPSASLKGVIRSLAEVVGNGTVPFANTVDDEHAPENARQNTRGASQLDIISRIFGYLHQDDGSVYTGLIHFSDAEISTPDISPNNWRDYRVVVGQPDTSHRAFYPARNQLNQRKFYHHHPGAVKLIEAPANIRQVNNVWPAPPGTRFKFTVDFTNLRDNELDLLLYCLELEKDVTVILSPAALGKDQNEPSFTFEGPLRHKMGGAKPHGAGSVRMCITKMELRTDAADRYRGGSAPAALKESALATKLHSRTASFRRRTDRTMRELRAMLIYSTDDPRTPIRYPTYGWFNTAGNSRTQLKPTI